MESVKQYREPSTNWVKIWIGVGVAAIVLGLLFLLVFGVYLQSENERKEDCDAGVRNDCEPSLIWALQGVEADKVVPDDVDQAELKDEADQKLELEYEQGVRYYQTSEETPMVAGVEMRGTDYGENWYLADAGTEIEIVVRPEGEFERVELYVHPKLTATPGIGIHEVGFSPQENGTYLAVYRMPANLEADLEARVVQSADEYGSAFIQVRSR